VSGCRGGRATRRERPDTTGGEGAEVETASGSGSRPAAALETGRAVGGVWALAWPAILGNLLNSTVGLVDIKIVGVLGPAAVAAVTTGNRLFFVIMAVLMAVTTGTTALVARAWGANDRDEAERVTRASLWLCVALALALSVVGIVFAHPIAGIFRLEAETVELAALFIRWLCFFQVSFAIFFVLATALRAAGDTRTPLWIGAFANVVNVVFAYGLVNGRFGLPRLGVAGAAIAAGIAFTTAAVVTAALWGLGGLRVGVGPPRSLERDRVARLLRIGYPAGLEQGVWQGGFLVFLWIVSLYGTAPYAAYGIGVSILSFSFVVGFGFSIAAATLVGQHLGAGNPDGAARSGWQAMGLSVGVMVVFGTAIVLFARPIARFLIDDPDVVRLTVIFIYVLGSVQALMAVEFTLAGALRGAGDTRFPLFTVLCGLFGARIALAALFAWLGLPVEWVFGALIADYVVKASLLIWRFRSRRWAHALA
jgi:putative MATE family efflux protein